MIAPVPLGTPWKRKEGVSHVCLDTLVKLRKKLAQEATLLNHLFYKARSRKYNPLIHDVDVSPYTSVTGSIPVHMREKTNAGEVATMLALTARDYHAELGLLVEILVDPNVGDDEKALFQPSAFKWSSCMLNAFATLGLPSNAQLKTTLMFQTQRQARADVTSRALGMEIIMTQACIAIALLHSGRAMSLKAQSQQRVKRAANCFVKAGAMIEEGYEATLFLCNTTRGGDLGAKKIRGEDCVLYDEFWMWLSGMRQVYFTELELRALSMDTCEPFVTIPGDPVVTKMSLSLKCRLKHAEGWEIVRTSLYQMRYGVRSSSSESRSGSGSGPGGIFKRQGYIGELRTACSMVLVSRVMAVIARMLAHTRGSPLPSHVYNLGRKKLLALNQEFVSIVDSSTASDIIDVGLLQLQEDQPAGIVETMSGAMASVCKYILQDEGSFTSYGSVDPSAAHQAALSLVMEDQSTRDLLEISHPLRVLEQGFVCALLRIKAKAEASSSSAPSVVSSILQEKADAEKMGRLLESLPNVGTVDPEGRGLDSHTGDSLEDDVGKGKEEVDSYSDQDDQERDEAVTAF